MCSDAFTSVGDAFDLKNFGRVVLNLRFIRTSSGDVFMLLMVVRRANNARYGSEFVFLNLINARLMVWMARSTSPSNGH